MNYSPHVETIYFDGDCEICGTEFYLLKDIESGNFFYYCAACGCAYKKLEDQLSLLISYVDLAPSGIDVVNSADIKELAINFNYHEPNSSHHNVMLSDAWVYTNLKQEKFSKAKEICEHAIATWHHPPKDLIAILNSLENGETEFKKIWKST